VAVPATGDANGGVPQRLLVVVKGSDGLVTYTLLVARNGKVGSNVTATRSATWSAACAASTTRRPHPRHGGYMEQEAAEPVPAEGLEGLAFNDE
jgi:hypothetical protein